MSIKYTVEKVETFSIEAGKLSPEEEAERKRIDESWKEATKNRDAKRHEQANGRPIVRNSSMVGPCIWLGPIVRETAKFYVIDSYKPEFYGTRKLKENVHIEPCIRCTDHPNTNYPMGYLD